MKLFIHFLLMFFPSKIKIIIYRYVFKYRIHSSARIGITLINVKMLELGKNSTIGHFNIIKSLDLVCLKDNSSIAHFNWITGFPTNTNSLHFSHQPNRIASLTMLRHSAITSRHIIDCTNAIKIGSFSTIAGFRSQFLTHSMDLKKCRQDSKPIHIGNYCFVGTQSVFLPGATIPDYSVVAACSMVKDKFDSSYSVYAGDPAKKVNKHAITEYKYFSRERGYVN